MNNKTPKQIVEYVITNPNMSCWRNWSDFCALPASELSDDICDGWVI